MAKTDSPADQTFSDTRLKVSEIIWRLVQAIDARVTAAGDNIDPADLATLEKLIMLDALNRLKVHDLKGIVPRKYRQVISDAELMRELRGTAAPRDETNFPPKGPRGPREAPGEDVSPEAEEP